MAEKVILVTGASGFIGRELIRKLVSMNVARIILLLRSPESYCSDFEGLDVVYSDMSEYIALPKKLKGVRIDTCIHLAWAGAGGPKRADYSLQLKNIEYSMNLVDSLAEIGCNRFVGVGTLVERDIIRYHDVDYSKPEQVTNYGVAKLAAHYMARTQCNLHNIEFVWCTLSNTYGVGDKTNNFINLASSIMLNGEYTAFTAGEQYRDFTYITDLVKGLIAAAEYGRSGCSYYIGSTQPRKLKEYIKIIRDTIDPNIELHLGEIPYYGTVLPLEEFDTSKLVEDTGFIPEVPFETGIKATVDWLRGQK